jgi:hypothetical protein
MSRHNRNRRQERRELPMMPPEPHVPDAIVTRPLPLAEMSSDGLGPEAKGILEQAGSLRCYRLGECTVIVTREFGRWHLSIAHPRRDPTWLEISQARYRLLPGDLWVGMYLPPKEEYVNLHRFCFQLYECAPPDDGGGML